MGREVKYLAVAPDAASQPSTPEQEQNKNRARTSAAGVTRVGLRSPILAQC